MHIRQLLAVSLSALLACSASAEQIDPNTADGFIQLNRKVQCSLKDNEPQVFQWFGRGYARVPGERDKHIFNLDGMNIRQCVEVSDPQLGTGYKMVSKEIMLYLDPQTNEIMRTFDNPWTGVSNEVIHVANDPVNHISYARTASGEERTFDFEDMNGQYLIRLEVPLFYTNPLAGDYQQYVGGTYHATEIFDFNGSTAALLDPAIDVEYPVVSWVRIAQWLPWMEMGSRSGLLYFNAMGRKLEKYEQLSDLMKNEIATNYPEYTSPPPGDDQRRNETSWTYMKKIIDARKAE